MGCGLKRDAPSRLLIVSDPAFGNAEAGSKTASIRARRSTSPRRRAAPAGAHLLRVHATSCRRRYAVVRLLSEPDFSRRAARQDRVASVASFPGRCRSPSRFAWPPAYRVRPRPPHRPCRQAPGGCAMLVIVRAFDDPSGTARDQFQQRQVHEARFARVRHTPVKTTSASRGISTPTFFRLCSRAHAHEAGGRGCI
jgi:hypothetical protein